MNIDEAIKLLRDVKKCHCVKDLGYYETAVHLGIEALNRVKCNRDYSRPTAHWLLPGETPSSRRKGMNTRR